MIKKDKGFSYIYTKEKAEEYHKLSLEQRLEWLEKMNRFLYAFMPEESKLFEQRLRYSKI